MKRGAACNYLHAVDFACQNFGMQMAKSDLQSLQWYFFVIPIEKLGVAE
jgi:hypothetical protein